MLAEAHAADPSTWCPKPTHTETVPAREPSEDVKRQVRDRDQMCLCCGENRPRQLRVDHINSYHFGGSNIIDNLQTLCAECNRLKDTQNINFLDPQTDLTAPLDRLPEFEPPRGTDIPSAYAWVMFLSRTCSFFYRCGAVHWVQIAKRGPNTHHWTIELKAGNDPNWLEPHLPRLLSRIRTRKSEARYGAPTTISVTAPDFPRVTFALGGAAMEEPAETEAQVDEDELSTMTVAEARSRRVEAKLGDLTGLSPATVERRLSAAHGRALLRNVFEQSWPARTDTPSLEDLGALTVFRARERELAEAIAQATGLSKATVQKRLSDAHGKTFVSNAFADRWPGNEGVDELGQMTAAQARERSKAEAIADVTNLAVALVERRLVQAHGKTLLRNVFASNWPGVEDVARLGQMSVADVREQGLVDTIARVTRLSAATVERRLRSAHGKTLLRNAFDDTWPDEED